MGDSSATQATLLRLVRSPDFCAPEHIYSQANCCFALSSSEKAHITPLAGQMGKKTPRFSAANSSVGWQSEKEPAVTAVRNLTPGNSRQRKSCCWGRLLCRVFSVTVGNAGVGGLPLRDGCRRARSTPWQSASCPAGPWAARVLQTALNFAKAASPAPC